jgi:hypothetical protein
VQDLVTGDRSDINSKLSPLIKDYQPRASYELQHPGASVSSVSPLMRGALAVPSPHGNGHQPPPVEASFQHYRANNFENRNKVIWNNTDFRIFNRDNPRSLGGQIPTLEETQKHPVIREQRRIRGLNPRMPLEDPEIRQKLGLLPEQQPSYQPGKYHPLNNSVDNYYQ